MKTYSEINIDGLTYWYRVTGNRYGWTLHLQLPTTLQLPNRTSLKYPVWEQPLNKKERKTYYENVAREAYTFAIKNKIKF